MLESFFLFFALNSEKSSKIIFLVFWSPCEVRKEASEIVFNRGKKERKDLNCFSLVLDAQKSILDSIAVFYLNHLINIKPQNLYYCSNFVVSLLPNSSLPKQFHASSLSRP